jgi:hypothetical protein
MDNWELKAGAVVLVLTAIGKLVNDYHIDKRETRLAAEKAKRDEETSRLRLEVLQEIARSNSNIREGQIEQNGKLSAVMKVNETFHAEMLRALPMVCKAQANK